MNYEVTVTRRLESYHLALLRDGMNGVPLCFDDSGAPYGMDFLIELGFMREIPDPNGTVRPYFTLTQKGREFCRKNFKEVTRWEIP